MSSLDELVSLGDGAKLVLSAFTGSSVRPPFVEVRLAAGEDGHLVTAARLLAELRLRAPGYQADLREVDVALKWIGRASSHFVVRGIRKVSVAAATAQLARDLGGV